MSTFLVDGRRQFARLLGSQILEVQVLHQGKAQQPSEQRSWHRMKQRTAQGYASQRGSHNLIAADVELANDVQDVHGPWLFVLEYTIY